MTHLDDKTASTDVDVEDFARAFTLNVTNVAGLTFALLPGREHLAAFTPDGGEHGIPRDQRSHAPQRSLLLGGASALGHVAAHGVDEAFH